MENPYNCPTVRGSGTYRHSFHHSIQHSIFSPGDERKHSQIKLRYIILASLYCKNKEISKNRKKLLIFYSLHNSHDNLTLQILSYWLGKSQSSLYFASSSRLDVPSTFEWTEVFVVKLRFLKNFTLFFEFHDSIHFSVITDSLWIYTQLYSQLLMVNWTRTSRTRGDNQ